MFAFFDSISSIFETLVGFVVSIFEAITNLIRMVVKGYLFLTALLPNLPAYTISFLTVIVVICVLLQLINHGS